MRTVLLIFLWAAAALAQALVPLATRDFTISHPADWEMRPANFASALFLYPGTDIAEPAVENFHVSTSRLSENMSFDSYTFMAKYQVEQDFPQVKLVRSQPVTLGKLKGHRFDYAGPHQGHQLQIVQVMLMKNDLGYTLWFVANPANYKKFSHQAEAMIRSFKPN